MSGSKPILIGISFLEDVTVARWRSYVEAVESVGAVAVLLESNDRLPEVEGLLLTGGSDIDPSLYGEGNQHSEKPDPERDQRENALFRLAVERGMPVLGICRGMQVMNVAMGGGLIQDLQPSHRTNPPGGSLAHRVRIAAGTRLARILSGGSAEEMQVQVNSRHHQGVTPDRLAAPFVATAYSCQEGDAVLVIEGLETPRTTAGGEFVLGVQWHPERLSDQVPTDPGQPADFPELAHRLFSALLEAAQKYRSGKAG